MSVTHDLTAELFPWNDSGFRANPYPWYERARRIDPVHRADDGTFVITRYDDAMRLARLPGMSIVEPDETERHPWREFENTVLWLDPPQHTRMRRLTNRWFTPKQVATWIQTTDEVVTRILDELAPGQQFDAHFELGVVPTHLTMCRVLDMPVGDVEGMFWALWDAMLIHSTDPGEGIKERSIAGLRFMFDQTEALLAEKQATPGDGLVDELLAAHARGELTWREVLETTVLLHMSGGPNPAYLIGAAVRLFAARPDLMREFRDVPDSRDGIVNELARLNPVELIITRFTAEDIEVRGTVIPAGSCLKFPLGAANRDPEVFDDPDVFDHARAMDPSRALTFGLGTHTCAGRVISLAQIKTILGAVAQRYDRVELVGEPVELRTDRLVAFEKLPVVLH